jgi:hypothetical protein
MAAIFEYVVQACWLLDVLLRINMLGQVDGHFLCALPLHVPDMVLPLNGLWAIHDSKHSGHHVAHAARAAALRADVTSSRCLCVW